MKFVHAADLHLDSPLLGLSRYEGAPVDQIRSATRRACGNLVNLCIDEGAELLLLAGDLFDGDWKDYSTGLFFVSQMARLKQAGVQVALIRGNHDAASHITKHLKLPDNCHELSTRNAESRIFDELGVVVHGRGYGKRAETSNLAATYPDASPGYLNIGLLHTCASGRAGHEPYAPCGIDDLRSKGYQYWALGHVHQREVLCEDPWIVFSGNLQGRHLRETGSKGATLVTAEGGVIVAVEHRELDVVRFVDHPMLVKPTADADAVVDDVGSELERLAREADGRTLVVRVTLSGACQAHAPLQRDPERWENEIRGRAAEHNEIWLEGVVFDTSPMLDIERVRQRRDPIGQVLRAVHEAREDPSALAEFADLFAELSAKLPAEVRLGPGGLRLDEPATLKQALSDVERLLLVHLLGDSD